MNIETKQTKKQITKDKFTKFKKFGQFKETKDGYFYEETIITCKYDKEFKTWSDVSTEVKLLPLEESPLKAKKSVIAHLIWQKDEEDKSRWNGVNKSYWYMKLQYTIRDDASNLYFVETDGKILCRDFHQGMTAPIALNESNSNYKSTQIGEIEKISGERASQIAKETGTRLIFGKVEQGADGQPKDFGIVV